MNAIIEITKAARAMGCNVQMQVAQGADGLWTARLVDEDDGFTVTSREDWELPLEVAGHVTRESAVGALEVFCANYG